MTQPCFSYLTLKFSHALFQCAPEALDDAQRQRVAQAVSKQRQIESAILASPLAAQVMLSPELVEHSLAQIIGRFASETEFIEELARNGLTPGELTEEIRRDQKVETILDKVATAAKPVSRQEAEIFYYLHLDRFKRPERRGLRHILITFDEKDGRNARADALARIEAIAAAYRKQPASFAELALRHSECPTALQGGKLGTLSRGRLFPEVDEVAFALTSGALSGVVESPMGFHLVLCESIEEAGIAPYAVVTEKIVALMTDARRQAHQRAWIRTLLARNTQPRVRRHA